ncbi:MAG: D-cysteine desulfhydrase family protein [Bdellovibrionales bacterium]|nr:D-cysteine desulfhydrase family protein [Bdellovibrionales bacterium]
MNDNRFQPPPRTPWARTPTPLHRLPKLSKEWGVDLWVKRDDQTGFEWSGNKIRKLEFIVHEALEKGATALITCGGVQSNHCRATAALAAKLGLRCVLVLRGERPPRYASNNLLDQLFGAEILYVTTEQYQNMQEVRMVLDSQMRSQGGRSYFIPEGGSNGLGAMGYLAAWDELLEQLGRDGVPEAFDSVVVAHGSGGTQAGLVLGKILRSEQRMHECRVVGVNVCYDAGKSLELVKTVMWNAIQGWKMPLSFMASDMEMLDGFVGRGYARSAPEELRFLAHVARTEGMLVDPVYTGKALFGLRETLRRDPTFFGSRVLFWHTGGAFGNFQVEDSEWREVLP